MKVTTFILILMNPYLTFHTNTDFFVFALVRRCSLIKVVFGMNVVFDEIYTFGMKVVLDELVFYRPQELSGWPHRQGMHSERGRGSRRRRSNN